MLNLYGHNAGKYAQPDIAWDPSGQYILSNSQQVGARSASEPALRLTSVGPCALYVASMHACARTHSLRISDPCLPSRFLHRAPRSACGAWRLASWSIS